MRKTVFILLALFAITGLFAQERIAIFPFEDRNNVYTRDELDLYYREFSGEFKNKTDDKNFTVISRQDIEKIIDMEEKFQLSDYSSEKKTAELKRVLNPQQVLHILILKIDNNIRINVSRYSFPEMEILRGGTSITLTNKSQILSGIPELVQSMQVALTGRIMPEIQSLKLPLYDQLVNATGTTTITVTQDTPFQGVIISEFSSITLRGDTAGRTLFSPDENTYLIRIERGVTLTLENITLKGICVEVKEGGTLIMNNGSSITNCKSTAVRVEGKFTMNGGNITNISTFAAVYVWSDFTMNGGNIANNSANGVWVRRGIFTMNDGSINNNSDSGVWVEGTFNMNDGKITNNKALYGGGVQVDQKGVFNMKNGRIENNIANRDGGGVYVSANFYMYGGVIAGNHANEEGGGVHIINPGNMNMVGGTIYGSNGGSNANTARRGNAIFNSTESGWPLVTKDLTIYKYKTR